MRQPVDAAKGASSDSAAPTWSLADWAESLDAPRLSLAGLSVTSISAVHMYLGPVRLLKPTVSLLLLVVVVALMRPKAYDWGAVIRSPASRIVGGLSIMALLSAIAGISMGHSMSFILQSLLNVLVVFYLSVAAIRQARDLAVHVWGYVASVAILCVVTPLFGEYESTDTGLRRLGGAASMYDANDLAALVVVGVPMALLLIYTGRRIAKLVGGFVLVGTPVLVALTGSRGGFVGLAVIGVLCFFGLTRFAMQKRLAVVGVLVVGLALSAPDAYWEQMSTILEPSRDYNATAEQGRVQIWKRGVKYALDYPVAGVGIANFPMAEGTISPMAVEARSLSRGVPWVAPHSTYVQVAAELGPTGFLVWMALLYSGSVGLLRLRRRIPIGWERESADRRFLREATLFMPMATAAFAAVTAFLSFAYLPPSYVLFAATGAVHVLVRRELARGSLPQPSTGLSAPAGAYRPMLGRGGGLILGAPPLPAAARRRFVPERRS